MTPVERTAATAFGPRLARMPPPRACPRVCLLDLDPDLGRGIAPSDWQAARRATVAHLIEVARGEWQPPSAIRDDDILGMIIDDGMISREVTLGDHIAFELLGPCDVLLPATTQADDDGWDGQTTLCALGAVRLILLGTPFTYAAARWPSLLINLHRRLDATRQRAALQGLAAHLPRAEDRVLVTLRLLADRCGRVTAEGIVIPLSLSHHALGRLTAARRPTITLALRALRTADYIRQHSDGTLILTPAADRRIEDLTASSNHRQPLGARLALRSADDRRTGIADTGG